jgi:glycolate oxidase iron-sulfur subunit
MNTETLRVGAFDAHHAPSQKIIDKCVHCGFCLATCPTYVLWGQEMDSPRGRIQLMQLAAEGSVAMTPQWVKHFDTCLGCMACMPACPSGVDYGKLIEATRGQIARHYPRPRAETWYRRFLFNTLTSPGRLRALRWPLLAYQRTGLQSIVRRTRVLDRLPEHLRAMEALLPGLKKKAAVLQVTPAEGATRGRVGLLLGCVQREFLSHVNAATTRVLSAEGYEVVAPGAQPCCGALSMHAGEEESALAFARQMIDVFDRAGVEIIVTNAAGCGSNMKDYGYLLRDDPEYAPRARRFSASCKDITEFLAEIPSRAVRHRLSMRVAYHDACHLQHAQGVREQPRSLLSQIPDLHLTEIPESAICCGSAGIYNLVQPKTAAALGDRKAQLIVPLNVDVVATGNPGCILQLQSALARRGVNVPVVHTVQLLDAASQGTSGVLGLAPEPSCVLDSPISPAIRSILGLSMTVHS